MEGFPQQPIEQEIETIKIPEKVYRGYVVSVDNLTAENLLQDINPSLESGNDGNERGIYMSDNLSMVEHTNYSSSSKSSLETLPYNLGYGLQKKISLPGCGVVIEIDSKEAKIREPQISAVWQGHYNNGFAGKEWITDSIPKTSFRVMKLILGEGATDPNKYVVEVKDGNLDEAIGIIKEKYKEILEKAEKFKEFIADLPETTRMNPIQLKRKWQSYLQSLSQF